MRRFLNRPTGMIDTSKERFNESPGLKKWADLQNLKEAARVQSILAEKGINSFEELDEKISSLHQRSKTARKTTIALDRQLEEAKNILNYARQYAEKHIYEERYEKAKDLVRYYREHSYDIQLAWGARTGLESAGLDPKTLKLEELEADYAKLSFDRQTAHTTYMTAENECNKLKKLWDELTSYMGMEKSQENDMEKDRKQSL